MDEYKEKAAASSEAAAFSLYRVPRVRWLLMCRFPNGLDFLDQFIVCCARFDYFSKLIC